MLIRLLVRNALLGTAAAALFVTTVIWSDTAQLGTLIAASPVGWLAAAMLFFFTSLTFASVQMGIAIMAIGQDDEDSGRGRRVVAWIKTRRASRLSRAALPGLAGT